VKSDIRSSLKPANLVNHLYVNLNMPPLAEFNVRLAVQLWITDTERRVVLGTPSLDSEWFTGVFNVADTKWADENAKEKNPE